MNVIPYVPFQIKFVTKFGKNIKNKIYKFRRQSLTVYIPNDDRPWEYFENQSVFLNTGFETLGRSKTRDQHPVPNREGLFWSRESFRLPLPCSCVMLKSNDTIKWLKPWQSRLYMLVAGWRVIIITAGYSVFSCRIWQTRLM